MIRLNNYPPRANDIHKFARGLRVTLQLYFYHFRKEIYINWIEREKKSPKGSGARVLNVLIDYAEHYRYHIRLYPNDDELIPYYKSLGFEMDTDNYHMVYYADLSS